MKELVEMPIHINVFNGQHQRCDMLVGPCSCGAWHHIEDWKDKIENPKQYLPCTFNDIGQTGFFIYKGTTLCRFGSFGMGINSTGSVSKKFEGTELVTRTNPFNTITP